MTTAAYKHSSTTHAQLERRPWILLANPKEYPLARYLGLVLDESRLRNFPQVGGERYAGILGPPLRAMNGQGIVLVVTHENGSFVGGATCLGHDVVDLVVEPKWRRRGAGRFLIESMQRVRAELTASILVHDDVHGFWTKMKFTPTGGTAKQIDLRWERDW